MKNIKLLPDDLQETIARYAWNCGCGQEGLRLSVTKKGSIQGHCFSCGQTIFWNDPQIFRFENPFSYLKEDKVVAKWTVSGIATRWYPNHRVRVFTPSQRKPTK